MVFDKLKKVYEDFGFEEHIIKFPVDLTEDAFLIFSNSPKKFYITGDAAGQFYSLGKRFDVVKKYSYAILKNSYLKDLVVILNELFESQKNLLYTVKTKKAYDGNDIIIGITRYGGSDYSKEIFEFFEDNSLAKKQIKDYYIDQNEMQIFYSYDHNPQLVLKITNGITGKVKTNLSHQLLIGNRYYYEPKKTLKGFGLPAKQKKFRNFKNELYKTIYNFGTIRDITVAIDSVKCSVILRKLDSNIRLMTQKEVFFFSTLSELFAYDEKSTNDMLEYIASQEEVYGNKDTARYFLNEIIEFIDTCIS